MTKTKVILIILLVLALLIGIGIAAYPIVSSRYAESVRSQVSADYNQIVQNTDTSTLDQARAAAQVYNEKMASGEITGLEPEKDGYYELLDLSGDGIMCYIDIPKINIYLPVYHGVGNDAFEGGAGHMAQASLPVGGENTHTVIAAHTGMATSPMFTDLGLLEMGDIFYIHVLGEVLAYEVDQIQTVLPYEIDHVRIEKGMDLATLVTCTPYGVNTHRLLVRGHRTEDPQKTDIDENTGQVIIPEQEEPTSLWMEQYAKGISIGLAFAIPFALLVVIFVLIARRRRKKP